MDSYKRFQSKSKAWPTLKEVWAYPPHGVSFVLGVGLIRVAPGTWGSLVGLLVYWMMDAHWPLSLLLIVLCFILGSVASEWSMRRIGVHDHSGIVIDEVLGMWITLFLPQCFFDLHAQGQIYFVLAFLLFRIFDIWKPYPIRVLDERLRGGIGVMMDDVLAGFYAGCCLMILIQLGGMDYFARMCFVFFG